MPALPIEWSIGKAVEPDLARQNDEIRVLMKYPG
jgi:hypothetical protein